MDEPLEDPANRIVKRITDLLISLPMAMFVLPLLCILVKIVQAIQSPGPLFHRETRAGLGNRPFRIFDFRTTRAGSAAAAYRATMEIVIRSGCGSGDTP